LAKPDFSKEWATNGSITSISDTNYLEGFAYLGSNPPTVEEFNWLFQQIDAKLQWLNENSLSLSGMDMEGAINENAVTMASAATMKIGAAEGNFIIVTGTTPIAAFDTVQAGTRRKLRFGSSLSIVHDSESIIFPGTRNLIVSAGDAVEFTSLGEGIWACTGYLPAAVMRMAVPVRQTVLSGPVDSSGNAANLSSVLGGLAISELSGTVTTWANGYDRFGAIDYVQKLTADVTSAWSGLTASSTLYLYKNYDSTTGTVTYGFTTVAPVYQAVAPSSPAANQYWFDTTNMVGYYYTGLAWASVVRVFVGYCVTGTSSITSVTCYAYNGRYDTSWFKTKPYAKKNYNDFRNVVSTVTGNTAATITGDYCPFTGASFSSTIDFTTTGAGALDTGSIAASKFYFGYRIFNPSTGATACIASLESSASGVTLPSGYTECVRVCSNFLTNSSSKLYYITQTGSDVQYAVDGTLLTDYPVLASGSNSSTATAYSVASLIPTTANIADVILYDPYGGQGGGTAAVGPNANKYILWLINNTYAAYAGQQVQGTIILQSRYLYYWSGGSNINCRIIGWKDSL